MSGDEDVPIAMDRAGKHGDNIGKVDVADDLALARALLDSEVLIRDFKPRTVAL